MLEDIYIVLNYNVFTTGHNNRLNYTFSVQTIGNGQFYIIKSKMFSTLYIGNLNT